ncbi:MAG: hypothetical protein IJL74_00695 [Bacilli bacterium]|nr:hypothetical protein [Bacilli bacterium]
MKVSNTSQRLKEAMNKKGLKQVDILNRIQPLCEKYNIKMGSNDLSQYVTGKVEPSQKKLKALAEALDTNEIWLMGYNVTDSPDLKILEKEDYLVMPMDIEKAGIKKGNKIKTKDLMTLIKGLIFLNDQYKKDNKELEKLGEKLENNIITEEEFKRLKYLMEENKKDIDNQFKEMVANIIVKDTENKGDLKNE